MGNLRRSDCKVWGVVILLIALSITCASSSFIPGKCYDQNMLINDGPPPSVSNNLQPEKPAVQEETKPLAQVTVYTGNDKAGISHKLTFKSTSCQNLPEYIWSRTKSVDTHGSCVQLCEFKDCGGWCVKFQPGSPSHNRLRKLRFHNRAKSASPCNDDPIPERR